MTIDPALALLRAMEAALRASPAVASAMGGAARVYCMSAPHDAPFPHIVIGEDQVIGEDTECLASSEVYSTLHIWSRVEDDVSASRAEALTIAGAIRSMMRTYLTLEGFQNTVQGFEDARHLVDADGLTAHSVVTFRFLLDPA